MSRRSTDRVCCPHLPVFLCLPLTFSEIRASILDGDIDKALKYTNAYYANVLHNFPHIHFKLRCRKFLEMMRRCNELSSAASKKGKSSNGLSDGSAVFDQEMELDEQLHNGENWGTEADGMDMEEPETSTKFHELLTEAVQYGQQLRLDYPTDERGGDRQMLEDIFSLVAYPDAKRSVNGHYLDPAGRIAVAEELNSAILGKSTLLLDSHMWGVIRLANRLSVTG